MLKENLSKGKGMIPDLVDSSPGLTGYLIARTRFSIQLNQAAQCDFRATLEGCQRYFDLWDFDVNR